jgi:hypothetical protein
MTEAKQAAVSEAAKQAAERITTGDWTEEDLQAVARAYLDILARHACEERDGERLNSLPALVEALRAADRFFDGWCPNAQCCAGAGLTVHKQVRAALKGIER